MQILICKKWAVRIPYLEKMHRKCIVSSTNAFYYSFNSTSHTYVSHHRFHCLNSALHTYSKKRITIAHYTHIRVISRALIQKKARITHGPAVLTLIRPCLRSFDWMSEAKTLHPHPPSGAICVYPWLHESPRRELVWLHDNPRTARRGLTQT